MFLKTNRACYYEDWLGRLIIKEKEVRLQLLKDIVSEGFELLLVAPKDEYTSKIRDLGFTIYSWKLKRRSVNPISELLSLLNLLSLYKKLKPDLVHHFTIKSCIYGTIAAKLTGVLKVINAITGLGYIFSSNSIPNNFTVNNYYS